MYSHTPHPDLQLARPTVKPPKMPGICHTYDQVCNFDERCKKLMSCCIAEETFGQTKETTKRGREFKTGPIAKYRERTTMRKSSLHHRQLTATYDEGFTQGV